jgi:hypothetical protein
MVDERILLLERLKAHQDRWDNALRLAKVATGNPLKNEALLAIAAIAEEALAL